MIFKVIKLALLILVCLSVGYIGSFFTSESVDFWYQSIQKPEITPPDWVFAPVWTVLYILMGTSIYLIVKDGIKNKVIPISIFSLQLLLNSIWTPIFFGLHSIKGALIVIICLCFAILATIISFFKVSKTAALLLIPYFLWVCFAAVLNYSLFILN